MDVMGYTILEEESLPNFLKGRPQVALCLTCAAALLTVTALSVTIGIFIGYTYCYLEHRSGVIKANVTRTNIEIMPMPLYLYDYDYPDNKTRTINGAISNNFISNLRRICGLKNRLASFSGNEVKEKPTS